MTAGKKSIFNRLRDEHIDALQEIGNIGSGHAANALAEFLNRRIDMSLPRCNLLSIDEISKVEWRGQSVDVPFAEVFLETTGDLTLEVLVVFDTETVQNLLRLVRSIKLDVVLEELNRLDRSVIKEIGNILALHFITAMNTFIGTKSFPKPPTFIIETSETVLTSIANHFGPDIGHLLLIECDIYTSDMKLSPLVIMIPTEESTEETLKLLFGEV
ncbi:MAG: chemotaxis protein CheC [Candidatus Hodarchaeota archaeon]